MTGSTAPWTFARESIRRIRVSGRPGCKRFAKVGFLSRSALSNSSSKVVFMYLKGSQRRQTYHKVVYSPQYSSSSKPCKISTC